MFLPNRVLEEKLCKLLEEDVGQGDITTSMLTPEKTTVEAEVVAKEGGVLAGIDAALILCESLKLQARLLKHDGARVKPKTPVLRIIGDARTILSMERTLLNMLSRMSGVATATNNLVRKVASRKTRVACTRKVAPGLGYFDKKAVALGGGDTHRLHLDDLVLIKDNHIRIVGDLGEAVRKACEQASFSKKVEVEVSSAEAALQAAKNGADIIMLDNLSPKKVREAVLLLTREGLRGKVILEASGRINHGNIVEYAKTGVDVLSVGEITHSPKALDMSLKVVRVRRG
ncbi:MAG: carboxylating nicotinate-nucleotide diphosphorylase [Candidatus Bathyarchaeota archaeon]|jgi:nicotinate-nucleotide pyrophosphorylase (carboxylating)|nr:carboxylating nicotinate-nucleotide diphosphorylase [Candidatus Bathyarchaeota archaeon]